MLRAGTARTAIARSASVGVTLPVGATTRGLPVRSAHSATTNGQSNSNSNSGSSSSSAIVIGVGLAALFAGASLFRDTTTSTGIHADAKSKPTNNEECLKDLRARFQGDAISEDLATRTARTHDSMSYYVGGTPQAVIYAQSEQDVVDAVKICYKYKVPIIPWGAGTSIEGQLTPTERGGIVIDMGGMNKIVELNVEDMDAVVQAGKSWLDLNAEIAEHGVFFAPDPGPGASLGGMCGTSCSGTRAWRYGGLKVAGAALRVLR